MSFQEVDVLEHNKDLVAGKTRDMRTVITVADDGNVRIWDRTRSKQTKTDTVQDNFSKTVQDLQ